MWFQLLFIDSSPDNFPPLRCSLNGRKVQKRCWCCWRAETSTMVNTKNFIPNSSHHLVIPWTFLTFFFVFPTHTKNAEEKNQHTFFYRKIFLGWTLVNKVKINIPIWSICYLSNFYFGKIYNKKINDQLY